MKLRRQPGPPAALSWVHSSVWKVAIRHLVFRILLSGLDESSRTIIHRLSEFTDVFIPFALGIAIVLST